MWFSYCTRTGSFDAILCVPRFTRLINYVCTLSLFTLPHCTLFTSRITLQLIIFFSLVPLFSLFIFSNKFHCFVITFFFTGLFSLSRTCTHFAPLFLISPKLLHSLCTSCASHSLLILSWPQTLHCILFSLSFLHYFRTSGI